MKLEKVEESLNLKLIMLVEFWEEFPQVKILLHLLLVKPTSSILNSRETIDTKGKNTKISVKGRHDPCVGIRAVPIGEAMISCVLLDHLLMNRAQCG